MMCQYAGVYGIDVIDIVCLTTYSRSKNCQMFDKDKNLGERSRFYLMYSVAV
jgi:hypothetical protein